MCSVALAAERDFSAQFSYEASKKVRLVCVLVFRGLAGHTIILYNFPPVFFVRCLSAAAIYCFQYNKSVGTTPSGKRQISRTKLVVPLRSILEESLH